VDGLRLKADVGGTSLVNKRNSLQDFAASTPGITGKLNQALAMEISVWQARKLFNGINMKGCITRMSLATVAVLLESLPSPAAEVPTQERVRKLTRGAFFTRLGSPGMTA